jgi:hypothetical protein
MSECSRPASPVIDARQCTRYEKCARAMASMQVETTQACAANLMLPSHMLLLRSRKAVSATPPSCARCIRAGCGLSAHVLGRHGADACALKLSRTEFGLVSLGSLGGWLCGMVLVYLTNTFRKFIFPFTVLSHAHRSKQQLLSA